ncbi:uncharacterized protein LOC107466757 [Arachis duranensis]|uniref:Uncharacterized protein LOC107466757 n=1 Tax=Arachis duranensis TaxID=130453 RepID=A0A6P4BPY9_ARADU|nr:uncharacterized protein LOC107466757 [Arachis duranensis]
MANYLVAKLFPPNFSKHQRDKLRSDSKYYIWDDPHLWKRGVDQVIRRCVPESEIQPILEACHSSECGGHFVLQRTAKKCWIVDSGGQPYSRMLTDYMCLVISVKSRETHPKGMKCLNNLCCSVEAIPTRLDVANTVISFIRNNIVFRYGSPRAIVSDQGSHFCNRKVEALLKCYGVLHKVTTAYHLQTNRQAEVSNREIKRILEKVVNPQRKDWSIRLGDALRAYRTAYKTPLGMSPFRIVYGKACHPPVEIDHRAYWAVKRCNMDLTQAEKKDFQEGDAVLLYNSRLRFMPGKLCSRWEGPFKVKEIKHYGVVELFDPKSEATFKVNGHRVKKYHGYKLPKELRCVPIGGCT